MVPESVVMDLIDADVVTKPGTDEGKAYNETVPNTHSVASDVTTLVSSVSVGVWLGVVF